MHIIKDKSVPVLTFLGGYGEHGRSCFLIQTQEDAIMLDCGIMDTDPEPYPKVSREILGKVSHIFVSHLHKDHLEALDFFASEGFSGTAVMSEATFDLGKHSYSNTLILPEHPSKIEVNEYLSFQFGYSGHCPGGVWYRVFFHGFEYFYSGDFQVNPLCYQTTMPEQFTSNVAIIDMAHKYQGSAETRRTKLMEQVTLSFESEKIVLLPVQKYGRGLEILFQLLEEFPDKTIALDEDFLGYSKKSLAYTHSFQDHAYEKLKDFVEHYKNDGKYDIFLIGDTHLVKAKNQSFVKSLEEVAVLICTGRVKTGGLMEGMLQDGTAVKSTYSHHQSEEDVDELLKKNNFKLVYPFHNREKEVFL